MKNYAKTEEGKVEELVKAVADSGAKAIVSGAAVGEMALHYCERYKYIESPLSFCFYLFVILFAISLVLDSQQKF
ncbi:T-complex protein 1 subunit theta [Sarracenia purpurea var. burkii]